MKFNMSKEWLIRQAEKEDMYTHVPTVLCGASCQPFPKTPQKVLTVTINEDGTLEYLKTDSCDILLELGEVVTRRASHVEPADFWTRLWFHVVRRFVTDKSAVAAWTRGWSCMWRIDTSPVGGPILPGRYKNRQEAIDAEIAFLNDWFLSR